MCLYLYWTSCKGSPRVKRDSVIGHISKHENGKWMKNIALSRDTVEPLNADTFRDEQKCSSYRGVRLIELFTIETFRWDIDKCPS